MLSAIFHKQSKVHQCEGNACIENMVYNCITLPDIVPIHFGISLDDESINDTHTIREDQHKNTL